ncbi:MAG TPA: hypothetical protein DCZ94_10940 [Lentisphaeria bacterium]|nr:MAG: hypothetical protein A2X48_06820 [Lentisphaerae bacterium GWF2_49_21]HBC87461.1 hypothetical protein [Lentisphaeria bacterium]
MKLFYILLNLFLFILAVLLLALNLTFKSHLPDKILSMAPDLGRAVPAPQKIKKDRDEITDIAGLWENNLFSPYRSGEGGSLLGGAKPAGMELLGISIFGDVSGAIILDKQSVSAMPQLSRSKGVRTSSTAAPQNVPTFYKLGATLENGFMLIEVNSDSVVLSRGREQIVLNLNFDDDVIPSPVAAPPVPENPLATAPEDGGTVPAAATPAGTVPSPVIPGVPGNRTNTRVPIAVTPDESGTQPQPVPGQRPSRFRGPQPPRPDQ